VRVRGSEADGDGKVVVCIDDNPAVLEAYEILLKGHCRVVTAALPQEGLRLVKELQPDLVIVDLLMAEMPGEAVVRHIRASGCSCKVLVVSANPRVDHLDISTPLDSLQADWILAKPFDMIQFLVVTSGLLGTSL